MKEENSKLFFENYIGENSSDFSLMAQSGSSRINYFARSKRQNYIVTYNDNLKENEAFFYFSDIFSELNLNTPKIFFINEDRTLYIQEYLGKNTLSEIIETEGLSENVRFLVKKSLQKLYKLQIQTEGKIDFKNTFEYEKYDELPILNDFFYFKNFFADVLEIHYHKSTLLLELKSLIKRIENLEPKGLMIRDFQSRNIMVNEKDEISFIDYQSAMEGPLMYDVVSFLYQAKANFPEDFKNEMVDYYISLWKNEEKILQLKNSFRPIQLIRFLQVLGAYGFRGLIQGKKHFIVSIEMGISNLYTFSQNWEEMNYYPELKMIITKLNSEESKNKIQNIIFKH